MKSAWNALYSLLSADATLAALLAVDENGDPAIYPHMREDVEEEGAFPMVTTPGVSGEDRLNPTQGDVEISTWATVFVRGHEDPDAVLHSIDERMVALAEGTMTAAWIYDGVRVSVRTLGMREVYLPDRIRRRRVWTVGVA